MPQEGTGAAEGVDPGASSDTDTNKAPVTQNAGTGGAAENGSADAPKAQSDAFAELDGETREWLSKRNITDPKVAMRLAYDQAKLLGNAIRVPGKDATEEERNEFLNKLGRPADPDGYEIAPPKDLPAELPYDGERASEFKKLAHTLGLTTAQAQKLHDWAAGNAVQDFTSFSEKQQAQTVETAKAETEKLVKRWGPLTGETAKANIELADRALQVGGPDVVAELQRLKMIGPNKEILSEPLAVLFANIGAALFQEDSTIRGNPDVIGNPFADGEHFNLTKAMGVYKKDPDHALSLIRAAGKKPTEFGLRG